MAGARGIGNRRERGGDDGDGEGALPWRPVELFLPRFRFESLLPLAPALVAMGAADAFDAAAADFTGITGAGDFWLSDVIHKAYVDVNEEGTEAAGATAAALAGGAGPEPDTPLTVRVDRPFLFTIRNWSMSSRAKVLLFIGRVMDPTR